MFQPYDSVLVVRFDRPAVEHLAEYHVRRPPLPGDVGTVIERRPTADGRARYLVEAVSGEGETVWLAEFAEDELALDPDPPRVRPDRTPWLPDPAE